jgi:predicted transcriptional regulator
MAEALDNQMSNYFAQLNDAEKKSIIEMLKTFLKSRTGKNERISLDQYDNEVREAETEYQKGEFVKHEELLNQIKKWQTENMR